MLEVKEFQSKTSTSLLIHPTVKQAYNEEPWTDYFASLQA